jgi:hypothetical protein
LCQKVQIIVEHFHANVAYLLEGKAKAMVVTDSRKAAVKYKKARSGVRIPIAPHRRPGRMEFQTRRTQPQDRLTVI